MVAKTKSQPKLTDAERHRRFLDMAREGEASDDAKAFDKAFTNVAKPKPAKTR